MRLQSREVSGFHGRWGKVRVALSARADIEAAYEGDPAAAAHSEVIVAYPFLEAGFSHDASPVDQASGPPRGLHAG
jgi:hypothetical protein